MKQHRGGQWNLRLGRAWKQVPALLRLGDLHWLAVVELNGKGQKLQRRLDRLHRRGKLPHGYTVYAAADGDSAVIVRDGVRRGAVAHHRMGGVRWERKPGRPGLHPARQSMSLRIGPYRGGYRVIPGHMPPGPDRWPLRGDARAAYLTAFGDLVGKWNGRGNLAGWVGPTDWNAHRTAPAIRNLLERVDAKAVGTGVDYPVYRGVQISNYRKVERWRFQRVSDHAPRFFTVIIP